MGYDRGHSFPFDFEPNVNSFGSKSKGKLSPRSYPIQFERKRNNNFLSVAKWSGLSRVGFRLLLNQTKYDYIYNF